ncbi:hypothetical protein [Thermococcus camini]|uniref:Uncharacterized protein n=1 Tax=Thermococcus camini TaxID=2016373 RepID=A0A7G2D647_9EURY|nr:hypothetical protein [Thermococcus camini]CAD5244025.1 conserved exported protein of unknown function [Thermococcus camini]
MKKALLIVVLLTVLAVPTLIMASQDSVFTEYSGGEVVTSSPGIDERNSTRVPLDPNELYIVVVAREPLKSKLEVAIPPVARRYGLDPGVVATEIDSLPAVQFKGRLLVVYVLSEDEKGGLLSRACELNVVAYYSSVGDVQSFLAAYATIKTSDPEAFAEELKSRATMYLGTNALLGDVGIAWWRGMKAERGRLVGGDPCEGAVEAIAEGVGELLQTSGVS